MPIKCLYWDDLDKDDLDEFSDLISEAIKSVKLCPSPEIKATNIWKEAKEELSNNLADYDLLITDIIDQKIKMSNKNLDPKKGLGLIRAARSRDDIAIIALSEGGEEIRNFALAEKADGFKAKSSVRSKESLREFGELIYSAFLKRKPEILHGELKLEHDKSYKSLALMDEIGISNLKLFCAKIIEKLSQAKVGDNQEVSKSTEVSINCIDMGLSGAGVFWIQIPDNFAVLIKYSKDKKLLEKELQMRDKVTGLGYKPTHSAGINSIFTTGNYSAIATHFMEKSDTLLQWIQKPGTTKETIDRLMSGLWVIDRPELPKEIKESPLKQIHKILSAKHRARISHYLNEIHAVKLLMRPNDKKLNRELLDNFIEYGEVLGISNSKFGKKSITRLSHGDFHMGNILIEKNLSPTIIDPTNIQYQAWASDISRFSVDIITRGYVSGIERYSWDEFEKWERVVEKFIKGKQISVRVNNSIDSGPIHALNWITKNMEEIYPQNEGERYFRNEFLITLAVEFLRTTYRIEWLSMPKRLLGATGACIALNAVKV